MTAVEEAEQREADLQKEREVCSLIDFKSDHSDGSYCVSIFVCVCVCSVGCVSWGSSRLGCCLSGDLWLLWDGTVTLWKRLLTGTSEARLLHSEDRLCCWFSPVISTTNQHSEEFKDPKEERTLEEDRVQTVLTNLSLWTCWPTCLCLQGPVAAEGRVFSPLIRSPLQLWLCLLLSEAQHTLH